MSIDPKYLEYMERTFPQGMYEQWNKCFQFCKKMNKDFPELVMRRGYVYSHQNLDNNDPRYPKQYTHFWLETEDGSIVDPTIKQFSLLGELHYVNVGKLPYQGICNGCGQLLFSEETPRTDEDGLICGKCHWTNPAAKGERCIQE